MSYLTISRTDKRILESYPAIIEKLIAAAEEGNLKAIELLEQYKIRPLRQEIIDARRAKLAANRKRVLPTSVTTALSTLQAVTVTVQPSTPTATPSADQASAPALHSSTGQTVHDDVCEDRDGINRLDGLRILVTEPPAPPEAPANPPEAVANAYTHKDFYLPPLLADGQKKCVVPGCDEPRASASHTALYCIQHGVQSKKDRQIEANARYRRKLAERGAGKLKSNGHNGNG